MNNPENFWPQPFASLSQFMRQYNLTDNRQNTWRLTEYVLGSINALPMSWGRLVATDGIMCYVVRADRSLYKGHIEWFITEDGRKGEHFSKTAPFVLGQEGQSGQGRKGRKGLSVQQILELYA